MFFCSCLVFQIWIGPRAATIWFYHHQRPSHHPMLQSLLLTLHSILRTAHGTLSCCLFNNHIHCGQFMHWKTWVNLLTSSPCGRPGRKVWQSRESVVHHHSESSMSDGGIARVIELSGDPKVTRQMRTLDYESALQVTPWCTSIFSPSTHTLYCNV